MKIRSKLVVTFLAITVMPMLLIFLAVRSMNSYQERIFSENYGLAEQVDLSDGPSIRVFSRLTQDVQREIDRAVSSQPGRMEDKAYLEELNGRISSRHSFIMTKKDGETCYAGDEAVAAGLAGEMEGFTALPDDGKWRNYLDGETEYLIKSRGFECEDGRTGNIFLITDMAEAIPEIYSTASEVFLASAVILFITGAMLTAWIYHSMLRPIGRLQEATKQIRDGNLDFTVDVEGDDEIGQLCQDFEEMRIRLKESTEEKIQYDKENKELISNISHDLKTPITAIKGYVEGIMDGVASSPEKLDKYIRTIYNKANDMDRLIDELTFYSKIDTNKIPYNFAKINVADYFGDCIDELGLELESRGIALGYSNNVDDDTLVIADAEQIKRVINNIIANSLKYMDKKQGAINIRILDAGDFVQVEIEDNGKGIGPGELPYIFDRFYRTDSSRNSSKGGSGIGLSIVKKIVEDNGGKIWATSTEGRGTTIHFVLRKINP